MANQFTKGTRKRHDDATKDKIRAEMLSQRLYKFAKAKGNKRDELDMSQAQVAAARVLIERGKPALQAIEQVQVSEWDKMSEEELEQCIKALITSHPGLISKLGIGLRPVSSGSEETNELGALAANGDVRPNNA